MKEQINKELLKKIQENIKTTKPHGRWYGRLIIAVRVASMVLLAFIATFAMSFFLYDFGEKTSIFEFTQSPIIENVANFLFEFLIISLLGIVGIYAIYRQTDLPLVKERLWLLVGSFVIISGVSICLVLFSQSDIDPWGDFIGDTTHEITHTLPLRSFLEDRMENDMEENFFFTGSITKLETSNGDTLISVENALKSKTFKVKNGDHSYAVGDKIIVQYTNRDDSGELFVQGIKKL